MIIAFVNGNHMFPEALDGVLIIGETKFIACKECISSGF